jgi:hypothetical protein
MGPVEPDFTTAARRAWARTIAATVLAAATMAAASCGGKADDAAPVAADGVASLESRSNRREALRPRSALTGVPAKPVDVKATTGQTVIRSVTLGNRGTTPIDVTANRDDAATGVAPRAATIAPAGTLELRTAIACDRDGTRRVTVPVQTNEAGNPTRPIRFDVHCATPAVAYDGPLEITRGGTYRGNWQSSDPAVAAVSVRTTEPVVIENCRVRGPGNLIASRFSADSSVPFVDVTIRNCYGEGTGGLDVERGLGHFFVSVWPRRVVIENSYYASTTGVWVIGNQEPGFMRQLRIADNRVRNVTSRLNAVAVTEVNASPGAAISWNETINEPDSSWQEDVILTYKVVGTPADPFRVNDNFVDGAYSRNPRVDPSTGSGINVGDGDPTGGNRYVHGVGNHVVRAVNVGTFIAAGSDNLLSGNRVLRSGLLPDGSRIDHRFTGLYVWDCCYGQVPSGIFRNNIARDNLVGYESVDAAGNVTRHENKLDDCATDAQGQSLCTGNTAPQGRVTPQMEDAERGVWLDRVAARGLPLGPK